MSKTMDELFVIPQSDKGLIARLENDSISVLGSIDIAYDSETVITESNLIISLCHYYSIEWFKRIGRDIIKVFDTSGNLLTAKEGTRYKTIEVKHNTLYLAGSTNDSVSGKNGEMFSLMDMNNLSMEGKTVDLPIKPLYGKSIDDILIYENRMVLVDNIVFPKFLFEFDIKDTNNPVLLSTKELTNNGTYEHIIKGNMDDNYLVLFSSTVGESGYAQHIVIERKEKSGVVLTNFWAADDGRYQMLSRKKPEFTYRDICLYNDYLIVLGDNGLAYIDLRGKISDSEFNMIKTEDKIYEKLIKTKSNKIIAVSPDKYELIKLPV